MRIHAFCLQPGQDLRLEIERYARSKNILAGVVLSCVGSVRRRMVCVENDSLAVPQKTFQIVALQGTLARGVAHFSVSLAGEEGKVCGGYMLEEGYVVEEMVEVVIGSVEELVFDRELNQTSQSSDLVVSTHCAGGVVLNPNGQFLVIYQYDSFWGFPKGHIEQGEDALRAARREIYEESGISQLEYIKPLGSYRRIGGIKDDELKTISLFLFHTKETTFQPTDLHMKPHWIEKDKLFERLTIPKDKEFLSTIMDQL